MRLGLGDSVDYRGDADLVFSHLYGPLPKQLIGKPAIINLFGDKKAIAQQWCGAELIEVGRWARGLTNTLYRANFYFPVLEISDLVEDEFAPGRGWFPEALAGLVLSAVNASGPFTVFDGFMGRGTVGKICVRRAHTFVGIDIQPERVAIAREYLGC